MFNTPHYYSGQQRLQNIKKGEHRTYGHDRVQVIAATEVTILSVLRTIIFPVQLIGDGLS